MDPLAQFCRTLKKDYKTKKQDTTKSARAWSEKDILNKKTIDAFVIIFKTQGCSWAQKSGCTMCGYFNESTWNKIPPQDLLKQLDYAMQKYSHEKLVKIFTSGSFLDDKEIPSNIRKKILKKLYEKTEKISIESRPEFITKQKLSKLKEIIGEKKFEIGIGLETANDIVRKHAINKGFTFQEYKKSIQIIKKHQMNVKTYVLIKPPFLTEKESIKDAIQTTHKIKKLTDTISFNPVNVQKNTIVEYLWKRNQYSPPWLWSIIEILKENKKAIQEDILLKCDIAGGGSIRGPHNCKKCNTETLNKIRQFSITQKLSKLNSLNCKCKQKWLDQLELEKLSFGSITKI